MEVLVRIVAARWGRVTQSEERIYRGGGTLLQGVVTEDEAAGDVNPGLTLVADSSNAVPLSYASQDAEAAPYCAELASGGN